MKERRLVVGKKKGRGIKQRERRRERGREEGKLDREKPTNHGISC